MPLLKLRNETPLDALLRLYRERRDLQEVFAEADRGDYRRLIDWAAGVAGGRTQDSAYGRLRPHGRWYRKHFTNTISAPPVPWPQVQQTSATAANPLHSVLRIQQSGEAEDISQHLGTLALLVTEFRLQEIVELGTRMGSSTLALLEAANLTGGRVLSIDVDECREAREKVAQSGLQHLWRFFQGSDLEVPDGEIPPSIDLLFIDTNHLYEHTLAELRKYAPRVRPGGWIVLHDYVSYAGVTRAVGEFLAALPQRPRFYPYLHQNGLALIRLDGSA